MVRHFAMPQGVKYNKYLDISTTLKMV